MTLDEQKILRRRISIFIKTLPYAWAIHLVYLLVVLIQDAVRRDLIIYVVTANVLLWILHIPIYKRFLSNSDGGFLAVCSLMLTERSNYRDCTFCLLFSVAAMYFHFFFLPAMQAFDLIASK
jgi:hypothetical protein